jgi:hypothetical protein
VGRRGGGGAEDGEEEEAAGAGCNAVGRHGWGWSEMGHECVREDTAVVGGW